MHVRWGCWDEPWRGKKDIQRKWDSCSREAFEGSVLIENERQKVALIEGEPLQQRGQIPFWVCESMMWQNFHSTDKVELRESQSSSLESSSTEEKGKEDAFQSNLLLRPEANFCISLEFLSILQIESLTRYSLLLSLKDVIQMYFTSYSSCFCNHFSDFPLSFRSHSCTSYDMRQFSSFFIKKLFMDLFYFHEKWWWWVLE